MFVGKFSMKFLFAMLFLINYGVPVEKVIYEYVPADFLFLIIFTFSCISSAQVSTMNRCRERTKA